VSFTVQQLARRPALSFLEGPATDGYPVLFLHGVGRCAEDFLPLARGLCSQYRVHALDLRGHGSSEWQAEQYRVVDYVPDVIRFVRALFQKRVVLCGHSLGAMVALAVAIEIPESIQALVLEDPPFHTMGSRIASTHWQTLFRGMYEVARRGGTQLAITEALSELPVASRDGNVTTLGRLRSRDSLEFSALCLSRLDPEVFTPIIEQRWLDGYDERELFARVKCPVLLLQGDPSFGGALTEADSHIASRLIQNCQIVRFPETGHLIHLDHPKPFLHALDNFMASAAPSGSPRPASAEIV
jgi:pimeloyl-ACP methyl ester carboxylesterase